MLASASLSLSLCFYLSLCFLVATGYKQYVGTLRKRQWSPSPDSSGPPPLYAGKVTGKSAKPSIEETIGLESSFKEDSFLKNIRGESFVFDCTLYIEVFDCLNLNLEF